MTRLDRGERNRPPHARRLVLATILVVPALFSGAPAAARDCIPDKAAREMIAQGALLPLPEAVRRAGSVNPEQIAGAELCRADDGRLAYELEIREAGQSRLEQIPGGPSKP